MASFELDHPDLMPAELTAQIQATVLRHRTMEPIKCHRRYSKYKRLLEELASSRTAQPTSPSGEDRALRRRPVRQVERNAENQPLQ